MKLCDAYIPYGYILYDNEDVEKFFEFLFKYGKKVLVIKKTPFIYNEKNIGKVIRKSSTKKCREYSDMLNSTLYYGEYIKNKSYSEKEYTKYLEENFWQSKEAITKDKIKKLIEKCDNKIKGPSQHKFELKNRYYIIPHFEAKYRNIWFYISEDEMKNKILDYSIYKLDDAFKKFLYFNRYNKDLFMDGDYVLKIIVLTDDHAIAISENVGDTFDLYLNEEEKADLKKLGIRIQWLTDEEDE